MRTKFYYFLFCSILFISCQKEVNFNGSTTATAEFTYAGSPSACTLPTINGTYMEGSALVATNTVTLSVTVTKLGSYSIATATINGIRFSSTGAFTTLGNQTITLTGSGKPLAAGSYSFAPSATGCNFSIIVVAAAPTATFTYNSASGVCSTPVINGTYTAGTALTAINTITLSVNVGIAGSYSINTNTINGVTFSGSGMLASGAQTITLTSTSTPTAAGSFNYTPTGGCSFSITYSPTSGGGGSDFLKCKINGVLTNFNTGLQAISSVPPGGFPPSVTAKGKISDIPAGVQELWVAVQNPGSVNSGVYSNITLSTLLDRGALVGYYPTGFPNIYFGTSGFISNSFTVNITMLTATRVEGNFSGTLYDQNGTSPTVTKVIDEGSFSVRF